MKFDRLKIVGFKTFVDPTELVIESGLTGVVGPNGCGKSNLVEALRWVMGETSHKSMRASGMDDVIFSGSGQRPARNHAEVMLRVDNSARDAPAAFNDAPTLEIARRIEREAGSAYRINGREVRARDVQLLFADAASGARSPSMVRQGQISEIISAKPQARRRILEDAAGIAGLHARRHDAELKLRAAEDNLGRVVDVLTHIDGQIDGLRRQARQAERYRAIATQIRKAEAIARQGEWHAARNQADETARQVDLDTRAVATALSAQGEAERQRAIAQHAIEPLRLEEARAGEHLQRLVIAREALDGEERRARARQEELERRADELERDSRRALTTVDDADAALARLASEQVQLTEESGAGADEASARAHLAAAETRVRSAETALQDIQTALAEATARRAAAERSVAEAADRLARLRPQIAETQRQMAQLRDLATRAPDPEILRIRAAEAVAALESAEGAALAAETTHRLAREEESRLRPALQDADRAAQRLETEARTIRKLFDSGASDLWPRAVDHIAVAKGYEMALGAAFGDDLEASTEPSAPAHWAGSHPGPDDPMLPEGAEALAVHVQAPAVLARRLAQVGVVTRGQAEQLRHFLKPGQRLVSREGDLWRWDGFVAAAEAPTAAARRLAEKNRLAEIEAASVEANFKRDEARVAVEAAAAKARAAALAESVARSESREARRRVDVARDLLSAAERRHAEVAARQTALDDATARLAEQQREAEASHQAALGAIAGSEGVGDLPQQAAEARARAAEARAEAAEARAALHGLVREQQARARRGVAIAEDLAAWQARRRAAAESRHDIEDRLKAIQIERATIDGAPAEFLARRRILTGEIETAEGARRVSADARTEGETILLSFDRLAREALAALSETRERRARSEAQLEAALERITGLAREIEDTLGVSPEGLAGLSGIDRSEDLPPLSASDARLADLRRERDRIGPVNLRADQELGEVEATRSDLAREHSELGEAIRKLRRGIDGLNAEGRTRLIAAFEVVNGHFRSLFARLFGGGAAELQLIESDDPLEAGLEILAHPPGKKPQVLTLLSGGEQALTATALIFAVFLTNPSPVCVLDEVDAPLDDANVERLCDLLADMAQETQTRFVIITHNPISMARMDRLFGVTMAERGVSQLVSVDLEAAERLAETG